MKFHIYRGMKSNGDAATVCIDPDELGETDSLDDGHVMEASDYFPLGVSEIEKVGEVDIIGNDEYFDSGFDPTGE